MLASFSALIEVIEAVTQRVQIRRDRTAVGNADCRLIRAQVGIAEVVQVADDSTLQKASFKRLLTGSERRPSRSRQSLDQFACQVPI